MAIESIEVYFNPVRKFREEVVSKTIFVDVKIIFLKILDLSCIQIVDYKFIIRC